MENEEIIPPFTVAAMEAELRRILAIQATQIGHTCSNAAATQFLGGLQFEDWTDLRDDDVAKIDLSHFYVHEWLRCAYDFAFQRGEFWRYDSTLDWDVSSFVEGAVPQSAIGGEINPLRLDDSLVKHVVDLANARWNLDDTEGKSLTIHQLALLTGKSEKTVRNLISAEKIELNDDGTMDAATAQGWLKGRPGFVPNRTSEYRQRDWQAFVRSLMTAQGLAKGLTSVLSHKKLETVPGVDNDLLRAMMEGRPFKPDIGALQAIGQALELDTPQFVGLAVETSLRA